MSHNARAYQGPLQIPGMHGSHAQPPYEKAEDQDQDPGSRQSQLLADNGKDHIILGFRHEPQFLQAASKSPSEKSSAANRVKALDGLKALFIFFRISPDSQPLQTVAFRRQKYGYESGSCRPQREDIWD